jgi:hypothetical protein
MSSMAPETGTSGGGTNFFTQKIMGIPGVVWLIGAAAIAYFLFARSSSSSGSAGSPSTSGGGGTITTGQTTIDQGAVQVSVSQTGPSGASNPQPTPTPTPKTSTGNASPVVYGGNTKSKSVTAPGGKDLLKIADSYHIPEQQLVAFNPQLRQYVGTGKAIPKGTKLNIPASA